MKIKHILIVVLISLFIAVATTFVYSRYIDTKFVDLSNQTLPVNYASFIEKSISNGGGPVDFTSAAVAATPAVVHIKTKIKAKQITGGGNQQQQQNPFGDFFGFGDDFFNHFFNGPRVIPEQRASGSGVVINPNGYIVTNNHVIKGADEITVTLTNNKTYKATVVGADLSTDIAVIKIDDKNLPYLVYGNSDSVKLAQWVLAIGYPLNLDVTVTAGIISAKSRNIGINQSATPIESFLQTDAAVNPGNSGGALLNTSGQLVGINTAIASPTGSFAGYAYAIPSNIVKKVVDDIIKYGIVQRAYLGIQYLNDEASDDQKKKLGIKQDINGVYVMEVVADGAAKIAGIQKGDIITQVNGAPVTSGAELQGQIASFKPGDKIAITFVRDGKQHIVNATLKNKVGNLALTPKPSDNIIQQLGGILANVDAQTAKKYDIEGGVLVKKIGSGLLQKTRMQEGFIITSINDNAIKSIDDLKQAILNSNGTIRLQGFYPGYEGIYSYPLNLGDSSQQSNDGNNDNGGGDGN